jgi:hypothetical protein
VQAEADPHTPPRRRRRRRLQPDADGRIELRLGISRTAALGRLKDATSVERWWSFDSFARKPIIGTFAGDTYFVLRKSPKLDSQLQELGDLTNPDGLPHRPRPILWGKLEDLPAGGSRLQAELVDGVSVGWFLWLGLLVIDAWLVWTAFQLHDALFALVTIPLVDAAIFGLLHLLRLLYWPDREVLVDFVDHVLADVQVAPSPREAAAKDAPRRRRRADSTGSVA